MKTKPVDYRTQVIVVAHKGQSALVEYLADGVLSRKYVPAVEVAAGTVANTVLSQGIPYGYPWEEISITFNAERFANELHQVGIWTADDILKSPQKLWSALNATLADNIRNILEIAKYEKKGVKQNG